MWFEQATKRVFNTHSDIRMARPDVSLPLVLTDEVIASLGLLPMVDDEKPAETPFVDKVVEDGVVVSDTKATRKWKLVPLTADEIVQKQAEALAAAKAARHTQIAAIVVTTASGNAFDGDEKSQDRMARALAAMDEADTLPWVLHDNTVVVVGRSELREALRLAGAEMAAIWVGVYE